MRSILTNTINIDTIYCIGCFVQLGTENMKLKGARSNFSEFSEVFYLNEVSSPKKPAFQISVKSVKTCEYEDIIKNIAIAYTFLCKLIMITITSHIFINIFHPVHLSAIKFTRGNEKI